MELVGFWGGTKFEGLSGDVGEVFSFWKTGGMGAVGDAAAG